MTDWQKVNSVAKEAVATKDKQKIEELYRLLEPELRRRARYYYEESKYDANRDYALYSEEDFFQELALTMLEMIQRYDEDGFEDFGKLFGKAMRYHTKSLQAYRHRKKRAQRDEDDLVIRTLSLDHSTTEDGVELREVIKDQCDVEQEVIDRDLLSRVDEIKNKALAIVREARGERSATVYELRLRGLNAKEISEIVGITHDHARQIINRSQQLLRNKLLPTLVA